MIAAGFLALLVGAITAGAGRAGDNPPASCRNCHREIDDAFRASGMGRSIESPQVQREPVRFHHAASASTFTIRRSGGRTVFRHEETGLSAEVAAFVGSGRHSRTPVHRKPGGRYAELPLSYYAEGGGSWAMSPGFDRPGHSGMTRELSDGCVFCHASYPLPGQPLTPIGCERCHGSGDGHVKARGPIVNPRKLVAERRLEICLQCHLETGSRVSPPAIRRVGRTPFSFRPGEPLADFQIYFAAENPDQEASIPVNGAGSGMLASSCFQRSGGKLDCTTCHDPHGVRRISPDTPCLSCHPATHANRGSCTGCHMPKIRTEDAVHVVMTDHRIRRQPPAGDRTAQREEKHGEFRGPVRILYPPAPDPVPETRAYLAMSAGDGRLLASAIRQMPEPPAQFLFELGRLDPLGAVRHFQRALTADPDHEAARVALTNRLIAERRFAEAIAVTESAPVRTVALRNAEAVALVNLGRAAEAIRSLERAAAEDSWEPLTFVNLAEARRVTGDIPGFAAALQRAVQLRPALRQTIERRNGAAPR